MLRPVVLFSCLCFVVSPVLSGCADPAGPSNDPSSTAGSAAFSLLASASISLEKLTDGEDADAAPGPSLTVGETVTWTYVVKNDRTVETLTDVVVWDNEEGVICPVVGTLTLAPGDSHTCEKTGVVQEGPYENEGTAQGKYMGMFGPVTVTATDLSHYYGGVSEPDAIPAAIGIDIKPGSELNSLNPCSKGRLPVAILADADFNPLTLDPTTIRAGLQVAPVQWGKGGEDVNGDGLPDLVVHFKTPELYDAGLLQDDDDEVELVITGDVLEDFGGGTVSGSDVIHLVQSPVCG